jgi:hypothetical protein
MRFRSRSILAGLGAALLMGLAVGSAPANRLSTSHTRFRITWREVEFHNETDSVRGSDGGQSSLERGVDLDAEVTEIVVDVRVHADRGAVVCLVPGQRAQGRCSRRQTVRRGHQGSPWRWRRRTHSRRSWDSPRREQRDQCQDPRPPPSLPVQRRPATAGARARLRPGPTRITAPHSFASGAL